MTHHDQYILRVTAGATYDTSRHEDVHVNSESPIRISSDLVDARIHIRVKDYRGLPKGSPSTSPYFSALQHSYDRYSIGFSFTPKKPIAGHHLVFGNDFENPIRDRLPPLFDKAFGIVKWWIDPGLDGDVYGDEPYLYGALLGSINVLRIGSKNQDTLNNKDEDRGEEEVAIYEEGAEGDGVERREEQGIPADARQRQKHFLTERNRQDFEFEVNREYKCDFFNPYLDFNEFALKLGYGLPAISIMSHWDGQPLRTHSLRYVLKNMETNTELFVVIFQLVPTEEAKKEVGAQSPEERLQETHGKDSKGEPGVTDDDELD